MKTEADGRRKLCFREKASEIDSEGERETENEFLRQASKHKRNERETKYSP